MENEDILPITIEGIIAALTKRGCKDLTSRLDLTASSDPPFAGGGSCEVYQGALDDGTKVAIKSLKIYRSELDQDSERQRVLKHAAKEICHWSKLKHRNVLPLMGLAVFRGCISMISGWMESGNLLTYIRAKPGADRIKLCMDVCAGLCYIHENRMVHGDLKGENVMISCDGLALIGDFGNAQLKDLTLKFGNSTNRGLSCRWAAPELLLAQEVLPVSMEGDVYAYGMTALEALTGKAPFDGVTDTRVILLVASENKVPSRSDGISDGMWELLNSCWARAPSERPKITSVGKRLEALEAIAALVGRGCSDITTSIDLAACSISPRAGGEFYDVYRGALHSGTIIAIKLLRVRDSSESRWDHETQKELKHAAKELWHWSNLDHPNILPLIGPAIFRGSLSMVSEWMENGNLMTYLRHKPDVDRISLCMDVCAGLCYIHVNGMAHGSLNTANILISPNGNAIIAGFGNVQSSDLPREFTNVKVRGLLTQWMAPELLLEDGGPHISMEADVYAYGMTVLEVLTGKEPYEGFSESQILLFVTHEKKSPPRPDIGMSDGLWNLLDSCWAWDPSARPKITAVEDRLGALSLFSPLTPSSSKSIFAWSWRH